MFVTIDGKKCECEKGEYILTVAKRNNIDIPTLCHHAAISGLASCRVCIVEVKKPNGKSQVVVSCVYPIDGECEIFTNNDRIKKERGIILELLRLRAPASKEIEEMCEKYGAPKYTTLKPLDGEKCIMCGKCAAVCKELGTSAISTINRGVFKKISTPYDEPSKTCIGCKSCAEVCPTSAITFEEKENFRTIWGKKFTLIRCKECGKIIGTKEELEFAMKKYNIKDTDYMDYCDDCRRKHIANTLADTYGINPNF